MQSIYLKILYTFRISYNSLEAYSQFKENQNMFQLHQKQSENGEQLLFEQFQTQKRICAQYIKIASEKLCIDEGRRISEANELLQKLCSKQKVKDLSQWDIFSTRDSVILDDDESIQLSTVSCESKGKLISRKNILGSKNTRDFDASINQSLTQIERQCSNKTAEGIKKLIDEYKKIKSKISQTEKKQKNLRLKQKRIEELQQKNIILTKRIEDMETHIDKLKGQNAILKQQNSDLIEKIHKQEEEVNSENKIKLYEQVSRKNNKNPQKGNICNNNITILNNIITEKENIISIRYEKIKQIEKNIEKMLFKEDDACSNCCNRLGNIKKSILSYKNYLEQEGQEFDALVDNFRQNLIGSQKYN